MKFILSIIFSLIIPFLAISQVESTGLLTLDPLMKVQIDKNISTASVTLILTGPSDRWFALGFNAELMSANTDCVLMTSNDVFSDAYFPGGHVAPIVDNINNWFINSNTVTGTLRTIEATRPMNSGDFFDYVFTDSLDGLRLIWAYASTPTYTLFSHGADNYGGTVAPFATLETSENSLLDTIAVYPNPVQKELTINFQNSKIENPTLEIFSSSGQLLYKNLVSNAAKEVTLSVDQFENGIYFLKISSNSFYSVKKLIICK